MVPFFLAVRAVLCLAALEETTLSLSGRSPARFPVYICLRLRIFSSCFQGSEPSLGSSLLPLLADSGCCSNFSHRVRNVQSRSSAPDEDSLCCLSLLGKDERVPACHIAHSLQTPSPPAPLSREMCSDCSQCSFSQLLSSSRGGQVLCHVPGIKNELGSFLPFKT